VGADLLIFKGHEDRVSSAAFSPDGKRIVTASRDNTARVWDADTGKPIGEPLKGHEGC
jgi:WD40 repeat protein